MTINEIVSLALRIIMLILVLVVIPFIKKKYGDEKLNDVNDKIMTFVEAAEQLFSDGPVKKAWVQQKLADAGIDVSLDLIDAEIESYVLILHNELKKKKEE